MPIAPIKNRNFITKLSNRLFRASKISLFSFCKVSLTNTRVSTATK